MVLPGRLVRLGRRVRTAPRARLDRLGLMVPRALLDPRVPRATLEPPGLPVLSGLPVPPVPPVVAHWA